jgi:hypothetical protein
MIAGTTILIEGKAVKCPAPPVFYVKANGVTVEISQSHYDATCMFDRCLSCDRELWKLSEKGLWVLLRRIRGGMEKRHGS